MRKIVFIIIIDLLGLLFQSYAQGNLIITPKRVVFEGKKQKEELNLVNLGKEPATYTISFTQRNMKEDGSFEIIDKPDSGQMFADPYLRVFPRQVTLAPGEAQVVILQCRRKPDMLPGEYRSHLAFRHEKNYKPLGMESSSNDSSLVNIQLMPKFGMSIPVIIRSGVVDATIALSNLKLETQQDSMQYLSLTINRKGNISVYGNIIVEYEPAQGKPYQVGGIKALAVYTNISKRNVLVKLSLPSAYSFKKGKLKVRYTSSDDAKYEVYAAEELQLK